MRTGSFVQDLRHAWRALRQNPGYAAVIVATLAMGIGVNTAVFTVVNAVLLRPLPYEDAGRLAMVFRTVPRLGFARSVASFPDFLDWQARTDSFAGMAAYGYHTATFVDADGAEQWEGYRVTAGLFSLLGVEAAAGRTFTAAEDRPGAPPVVMLSDGLWRSRFGAAPDVVGRSVRLGGEAHVVVGIMPAGFAFPSTLAAYWVPLRGDTARMERDSNFLSVIGRLAPGVAVSAAQAEMEALAASIDGSARGANQGYGVFVEARHGFVVREARTALQVFAAAVVMILAIACANVANLTLVRGAARRRELAVRAALGAGRRRLVRLLLAESTLLAVAGGGIGVLLAHALLRAMLALDPDRLPRAAEVGLDGSALAFTVLASLTCGVAFGILPALFISRADVAEPLKGTAAGGPRPRGRRLQQGFVVAQVSLAMVLLVGGGLLLNSFVRLTAVEAGFDARNVIAGRVAVPSTPMPANMGAAASSFAEATAARHRFFERLLERVGSLPGVASAGLAYGLPFGRHGFSRIAVAEGMAVAAGEEPVVDGNVIGGDYLETMGIALLRGRGFQETDVAGSPPVALVNEALANAFWPGQQAVGRRLRFGDAGDGPWIEVVGVVADTRVSSLAEPPEPLYYRPHAQEGWPDGMFVAARATVPAAELVAALRAQLRDLDPGLPLTDVATAEELVRGSVAAPRFRTVVVGIFAAMAALLALVGLYGVVTHAVSTRTREIGIRVALGADAGNIFAMVLGGGIGLTLVGIGAGTVAALAATRFLAGMLYAVTPSDPVTFVAVAAALLLAACLACAMPARRATRADPRVSLISD